MVMIGVEVLQMKKSTGGVLSCPPTRTKLVIKKMGFNDQIVVISKLRVNMDVCYRKAQGR